MSHTRRSAPVPGENRRTLVFGVSLLVLTLVVQAGMRSWFGEGINLQTLASPLVEPGGLEGDVRDPLRVPRLVLGFTQMFTMVSLFVIVMGLLRLAVRPDSQSA